jgi:hypothetical protein
MSHKHNSTATKYFNKLIQFRQATYANLGTAKDALFELSDAVMDTASANSFAEFSCSRQFRRRWPSVYEALQDGRPDRKALMKLYCQQINLEERPFWWEIIPPGLALQLIHWQIELWSINQHPYRVIGPLHWDMATALWFGRLKRKEVGPCIYCMSV